MGKSVSAALDQKRRGQKGNIGVEADMVYTISEPPSLPPTSTFDSHTWRKNPHLSKTNRPSNSGVDTQLSHWSAISAMAPCGSGPFWTLSPMLQPLRSVSAANNHHSRQFNRPNQMKQTASWNGQAARMQKKKGKSLFHATP